MKVKLQCIKVRLPDGREGEFWGRELARDSELSHGVLSQVCKNPIEVYFCRAIDEQIDTTNVAATELTQAFAMLNNNRKN